MTIRVQDGLPILGKVVGNRVLLSPAGEMVARVWFQIPVHYASIEHDSLRVMPDHVHGILRFTGENKRRLGEVVRGWKVLTTNRYAAGVREHGWPRFQRRLWQRDFFDRVIRSESELIHLREYMRQNPERRALP